MLTSCCCPGAGDLRDLHSFPTRRSSDLLQRRLNHRVRIFRHFLAMFAVGVGGDIIHRPRTIERNQDRKSTRLNSSHVKISYAGFCLKKKEGEVVRLHWSLDDPVWRLESL